MKEDYGPERYIFHTQGVCPPEIHFRIHEGVLKEVRFVGGGCPGNAQLVSRFLRERRIDEVLELVQDIDCRNKTSCPDQLAKGLMAAKDGVLEPARSFRVHADTEIRKRVGLIGDLGGRIDILERLIPKMRDEDVETIYCLGNMTGNSLKNKDLLGLIQKEGILVLQGELDFQYAEQQEPDNHPPLELKERDYLVRLPHVLCFQIGEKSGMAFYGKYLQNLPGFSDFEPFALEMNMVCNLTRFLQDESVFPALEAMVPQFDAEIVIFSQIKKWGHWTIGGIEFVSLGPAMSDNKLAWGLLETAGENIDFNIMKEPYLLITQGS